MQEVASENFNNQSESRFSNMEKVLQELQTKYDLANNEKNNLQRHNRNLEEIAQNRSLALSEVKKEKANWIQKYDVLQNKYHDKIETLVKRYYLLLGLCFTLIFIFLFLYLPQIVESVSNLG